MKSVVYTDIIQYQNIGTGCFDLCGHNTRFNLPVTLKLEDRTSILQYNTTSNSVHFNLRQYFEK